MRMAVVAEILSNPIVAFAAESCPGRVHGLHGARLLRRPFGYFRKWMPRMPEYEWMRHSIRGGLLLRMGRMLHHRAAVATQIFDLHGWPLAFALVTLAAIAGPGSAAVFGWADLLLCTMQNRMPACYHAGARRTSAGSACARLRITDEGVEKMRFAIGIEGNFAASFAVNAALAIAHDHRKILLLDNRSVLKMAGDLHNFLGSKRRSRDGGDRDSLDMLGNAAVRRVGDLGDSLRTSLAHKPGCGNQRQAG
jgi:hypothetical protein